MTINKKRSTLFYSLILAMIVFAGCTNTSTSEEPTKDTPTQEKGSIVNEIENADIIFDAQSLVGITPEALVERLGEPTKTDETIVTNPEEGKERGIKNYQYVVDQTAYVFAFIEDNGSLMSFAVWGKGGHLVPFPEMTPEFLLAQFNITPGESFQFYEENPNQNYDDTISWYMTSVTDDISEVKCQMPIRLEDGSHADPAFEVISIFYEPYTSDMDIV